MAVGGYYGFYCLHIASALGDAGWMWGDMEGRRVADVREI